MEICLVCLRDSFFFLFFFQFLAAAGFRSWVIGVCQTAFALAFCNVNYWPCWNFSRRSSYYFIANFTQYPSVNMAICVISLRGIVCRVVVVEYNPMVGKKIWLSVALWFVLIFELVWVVNLLPLGYLTGSLALIMGLVCALALI
jgi:hypothetical protein